VLELSKEQSLCMVKGASFQCNLLAKQGELLGFEFVA